MTIAELMQSVGAPVLPVDPARTSAETEQLLEALYETVYIARFECTIEPEAPEVHVYTLGEETSAELAHAKEVPAEQLTKMALARWLQLTERFLPGETLQNVWNQTSAALRGRAAALCAAPGEDPVAARGRGRGRGRGAPDEDPVAARGRGRGRGRARGRG